jgi:hypothetical protein
MHMRHLFTFLIAWLCLAPQLATAQIITTIAGNQHPSNTGDGGPASAASIYYPVDGVFDKNGNYYIGTGSSGNTIRKINTNGIITTFAGTGVAGYNGDNIQATAAKMNNPQGLAVDSAGNVFVSEDFNARIRKIDIHTGIITTVCGTGINGFSGDGGPATAAQIFGNLDICFDEKQNLYVADYGNQRVRKITPAGIISTYAGGGTGLGSSGPATAAGISAGGLCTDNSGNLYISDGARYVYKVDAYGLISIYAGNMVSGHTGDGGPATAAQICPSELIIDTYKNLFISGYNSNEIRMITSTGIIETLAGSYGVAGHTGDGGPATAALLNHPAGLALDSCGNLIICGGHDFCIRKISFPKCNYLATNELPHLPEEISCYPNPVFNEL